MVGSRAIPVISFVKDDKRAERHKAVDKNTLFQDSVYLFSFEQSICVRAAFLSSCHFDLQLIHF